MPILRPLSGLTPGRAIVRVWTTSVILFFVLITVVIFPAMFAKTIPETHVIGGINGYAALSVDSESDNGEIFMLRGEWEFYPNQFYTFNDFTEGRAGEPRVAKYPHYFLDEPDEIIENAGYATYRMRVRVPESQSGIGIYSRYQYSAYEVYLNDMKICGAGEISKDISGHVAVFLPTHGYTSTTIGSEGRTFSVIVHVQNVESASGGLSNDIFIGSATSVKNLSTLLLTINGIVSGGLFLLFICFFLIYLNGRDKREYFDYTLVSLVTLFLSLTYGGESLMYSVGLDSAFLVRLEYCAFITGAFFANYSIFKQLIKSKPLFYAVHIYTALATVFFLLAPLSVTSRIRMPIIAISMALFIPPLVNSVKNTIIKHDFNAVASLLSYIIVFAGMFWTVSGQIPWDSVDMFSIGIMLHCVLQMLMFLHRYGKTEKSLKNMTETLEERITERTFELILMKERAEAATIAKSNFLANMSHEIRTPMNAVMGISDLMRTDNLDKVQLSYLSDIKKSSKALLQIINDILDFSKIESGKLEIIPDHFSLMAAYDNICSICRFSAEAKDLKFSYYFAPDVPHYIFGDEIRYRQVILNIISNAIKYTKEGHVDFRVEKTERNSLPFLMFIVEDTGIGIKKENLAKLFDAFEQLDSESNRKIVGTGLGLSITKLLVTLMNGEIHVESEYNKGSVFTVYLPLVEGDSRKVVVQENYIPIIAKDARVLVVDDNQINLTVATGFLALHGIVPDTASSGAEAIEKITKNSYDLVFMDHMMPEMDGAEATKIIRSIGGGRFRDLPIVALTANAVTGARELLRDAGMDDFLSKPINAAHINMILSRWLPCEKISGGSSAHSYTGDENDGGAGDIFCELYRIEDLDVVDGISHAANNNTVYLSILKQFCNEFEEYETGLMSAAESGDWANYTVRVHAMKGVFANIGVERLSKWASKLEAASRNKEYAVCQSETKDFCESMRRFYDMLIAAKLMETHGAAQKTPIHAHELRHKLVALSKACMQGDSDSAEKIREELGGRCFNGEIDAELDEINTLIASFDFEMVADKIEAILMRL